MVDILTDLDQLDMEKLEPGLENRFDRMQVKELRMLLKCVVKHGHGHPDKEGCIDLLERTIKARSNPN